MAISFSYSHEFMPVYLIILFKIKLYNTCCFIVIFVLNNLSKNYYCLFGLHSHQISSNTSGIHPALLSVLLISLPNFGSNISKNVVNYYYLNHIRLLLNSYTIAQFIYF